MRILALAGVGAFVFLTPIAIAIVGVLAIVILSQSQVIQAYPNGGGSYVVASDNLGTLPGLVAASALLIDYVLTVATSTAAGVAAISSFVPFFYDERVPIGIAFIGVLMIGNLRGIREAGLVFAGPTYVYVLSIGALIVYGIWRVASGDIPVAATPPRPFPPEGLELLSVLLVLRAFASGAVGLTGSEAIANGVPSMEPPEKRNATITLVVMGTLFGTIFLGLTLLAQAIGVTPDRSEQETLNSLITRSFVGKDAFYYVVQVSTAIILALAANTGFTGFPRLASVLANDRFMPRQFAYRGERLAFSFGILALALVSAVVLALFQGSVTLLIPLYTIGVFLAFTLSQTGLIRRWRRLRTPGWQWRAAINAIGALVTALVLIVVIIAKFTEGPRALAAHRDAPARDPRSLHAGAGRAGPRAPRRAASRAPTAHRDRSDRTARSRRRAGRRVRPLDLPGGESGPHHDQRGRCEGVPRSLGALGRARTSRHHRVAVPLSGAAADALHRRDRQAR